MKKIFKIVSKVLSSVIFVILLFIMAFLLIYVVRVKFMANNEQLGDVKINFYTILSPSMHPTIKAGDIIITYKQNNYYKGDIITFISTSNLSNGKTITHRIAAEPFELEGVMQYKTKGDNNQSADSTPVPHDNVLGKVVLKIPKAGYIQQFLLSRTGWITIILLPSLGIVIYDILKIFRLAGKKTKSIVKRNDRTDTARAELLEVIKEEEE